MLGMPHYFVILHVVADPFSQKICDQHAFGIEHAHAYVPVFRVGKRHIVGKAPCPGARVEHLRYRPALPVLAGVDNFVDFVAVLGGCNPPGPISAVFRFLAPDRVPAIPMDPCEVSVHVHRRRHDGGNQYSRVLPAQVLLRLEQILRMPLCGVRRRTPVDPISAFTIAIGIPCQRWRKHLQPGAAILSLVLIRKLLESIRVCQMRVKIGGKHRRSHDSWRVARSRAVTARLIPRQRTTPPSGNPPADICAPRPSRAPSLPRRGAHSPRRFQESPCRIAARKERQSA